MARGKALRYPNGYGSVVKLSGNRRNPFEVRINTKIDSRGYPVYNVLGRYSDRQTAILELAKYNDSPYDIKASNMTFDDVYKLYYNRKYNGKKQLSKSSESCTKAAYQKCGRLHNMKFSEIKSNHMQAILDATDPEGNYLYSHAMLEHIRNLFNQMYDYAMEYDIAKKNWSDYIVITKEDDDEHGVPFSEEDLRKLWEHVDTVPYADTILIYVYSGWRLNELLKMPLEDIDLDGRTFRGGLKTRASKNRIVPIHSAIYPIIEKYKQVCQKSIFDLSAQKYTRLFSAAVKACEIADKHTPHDCRHTFATMLNKNGADLLSIKRLMGHTTKGDITEDIYTHKDIEQLRNEIEKLKKPI